jgi:hypothetical protein
VVWYLVWYYEGVKEKPFIRVVTLPVGLREKLADSEIWLSLTTNVEHSRFYLRIVIAPRAVRWIMVPVTAEEERKPIIHWT